MPHPARNPRWKSRHLLFACVSYDPRVAEQCRDRRTDPVAEKHMANYCEYFEFVRREFVPPPADTSREAKARDTLKKLLGD